VGEGVRELEGGVIQQSIAVKLRIINVYLTMIKPTNLNDSKSKTFFEPHRHIGYIVFT